MAHGMNAGDTGERPILLGMIPASGPDRHVRMATGDFRDALAAHTRASALAMTVARCSLIPDSAEYVEAAARIAAYTERAIASEGALDLIARVEQTEAALIAGLNLLDQTIAPFLTLLATIVANDGTIGGVATLLDESAIDAQIDAVRTGAAARMLYAAHIARNAPAIAAMRGTLVFDDGDEAVAVPAVRLPAIPSVA